MQTARAIREKTGDLVSMSLNEIAELILDLEDQLAEVMDQIEALEREEDA